MEYYKLYYRENKDKWELYRNTKHYKEYQREYQREYQKHLRESRKGYYLYFLMNEGKVIYIGSTTDLITRINNHKTNKEFDKVLYKDLSEELTSREELLLVEYYYINNYSDNELINKRYKDVDITEDKCLEDLIYRCYLSDMQTYMI